MLATATAAVYTAKMAAATKTMAETSRDQLELLQRQATAAEASVEQTERTMAATMEPKLRAVRISGDRLSATMDRSKFSMTLENVGPVPVATIREAWLMHPTST
jgi:hypothetical protein